MRKTVLLLLALMFTVTLVACSSSNDNEENNSNENEENTNDNEDVNDNEENNGNENDENTNGNEDVEKENTNDDNEENTNNENVVENDDEETDATSSETLAVGEKADLNGLDVELTKIEKYEGSDFDVPENDYFLIVSIKLENNTDETVNVSSIVSVDFTDDSDESYSMSLLIDKDTELIDGQLEAGETISGQIAYDVNDSDNYKLVYEDILLDAKAEWDMSSDDIQ